MPEFDAPPVVETVISVQFDRLQLTNALAGWYWKSRLGDDWPNSLEAQHINDVFERFGAERTWVAPGVKILDKPPSTRLQLIRHDEERMVQVQDSRFIYNWKKKEGSAYPTFKILQPEFKEKFEQFVGFVADAGLGDISINQWEVVYVNRIPKGGLWESLQDWPKLIPGFGVFGAESKLDTFAGSWQVVIGENLGRIHIELKHAKTDEKKEIIHLQFTARGPVSDTMDLYKGCELGHETIVNEFANMTSELSHKHWKRRS